MRWQSELACAGLSLSRTAQIQAQMLENLIYYLVSAIMSEAEATARLANGQAKTKGNVKETYT